MVFLLYVGVVVDVIDAVAVVAVALGTVTKLHIGVVCICDTAHGTFMKVAFPLLDIFLGLFQINCLRIGLMGNPISATAHKVGQVLPEKDEVIEDSQNGQQG